MRYFFILGSNPVLSTAEIIALLDGRYFTVTEMYKQALIIDSAPEHALDAKALMARLGGTIKIGTIMDENAPLDPEVLQELLLKALAPRIDIGSATFGFSIYSLDTLKPSNAAAVANMKFRNVGMNVKRKLQDVGCSTRFVKAQTGTALTSAAVGKNNLLVNGGEFVVLTKGDAMLFGRTDVIQPFEEFSAIDYGRPERDTVQGMLPPKLARIMINLVHVSREVKDVTLLDPFCGSGTVITEALQIGFRELIGSDKNPDAVAGTKKNVEWLKEKGYVQETDHVNLFTADARNLRQHVKPDGVDAIVTEPYLGPPLKGGEKRGELQRILGELTKLYYESLSSWRPILKSGAPVVMAMPVFIHGMEKHGINVKEFESLGFQTESMLPTLILSRLGVRETKNKGLLYGRLDQRVWREIVRFRLEQK